MSEEKSVAMGVRLTAEQRASLEKISVATGIEVGQIIRMAVDALIKHYHRCGGRLVLPIDFTEMLQVIRPTRPADHTLRVAEVDEKL